MKFLTKKLLVQLTIAAIFGLIFGFGGMWIRDKVQQSAAVDACIQTFSDFCSKAFSCEAVETVGQCDALVSSNKICSTGTLPLVEQFKSCQRDIRQMSCKDPLPDSCLLLEKLN